MFRVYTVAAGKIKQTTDKAEATKQAAVVSSDKERIH